MLVRFFLNYSWHQRSYFYTFFTGQLYGVLTFADDVLVSLAKQNYKLYKTYNCFVNGKFPHFWRVLLTAQPLRTSLPAVALPWLEM